MAARQLTVRTLHRLGYGRNPGALKVLQELRCLQDRLDSYRGEALSTVPPIPGILLQPVPRIPLLQPVPSCPQDTPSP